MRGSSIIISLKDRNNFTQFGVLSSTTTVSSVLKAGKWDNSGKTLKYRYFTDREIKDLLAVPMHNGASQPQTPDCEGCSGSCLVFMEWETTYGNGNFIPSCYSLLV